MSPLGGDITVRIPGAPVEVAVSGLGAPAREAPAQWAGQRLRSATQQQGEVRIAGSLGATSLGATAIFGLGFSQLRLDKSGGGGAQKVEAFWGPYTGLVLGGTVQDKVRLYCGTRANFVVGDTDNDAWLGLTAGARLADHQRVQGGGRRALR